eukprot:1547969-Rhodomonas_salina.2
MAEARRISRSSARDAPEARPPGPATPSYESSSAFLYVRSNRQSGLYHNHDPRPPNQERERGKTIPRDYFLSNSLLCFCPSYSVLLSFCCLHSHITPALSCHPVPLTFGPSSGCTAGAATFQCAKTGRHVPHSIAGQFSFTVL